MRNCLISFTLLMIPLLGCKQESKKPKPPIISPFSSYMSSMDLLKQDSARMSHQEYSKLYFIDNKTTTEEEFSQQCSQENSLAYVYKHTLRGKIPFDSIRAGAKIPVTLMYNGLSEDYISQHTFEPSYFELAINTYNSLFLSLDSDYTGPMNTTVFDIKNGQKVLTYANVNYAGSHATGAWFDTSKYSSSLRAVLIIGDSIYWKDFDLSGQ